MHRNLLHTVHNEAFLCLASLSNKAQQRFIPHRTHIAWVGFSCQAMSYYAHRLKCIKTFRLRALLMTPVSGAGLMVFAVSAGGAMGTESPGFMRLRNRPMGETGQWGRGA